MQQQVKLEVGDLVRICDQRDEFYYCWGIVQTERKALNSYQNRYLVRIPRGNGYSDVTYYRSDLVGPVDFKPNDILEFMKESNHEVLTNQKFQKDIAKWRGGVNMRADEICESSTKVPNAFIDEAIPDDLQILREAKLLSCDYTLNPDGVRAFIHFLLKEKRTEFAAYIKSKQVQEDK